MTDIRERRAEVEARLARLRAERGAALLDGGEFDTRELDGLESQLKGYDAAEAELVKRQREAAETERRKQRDRLRRQLAAVCDEALADAQNAELAMRTFADCCSGIFDKARQIAELLAALGEPIPAALTQPEVARRLGGGTASILAALPGCRSQFGPLKIQGGSLYPADQRWREREAKIIEPVLQREEHEHGNINDNETRKRG